VHLVERVGNLTYDRECTVRFEPAFSSEQFPEIRSLDVGHCQIEEASLLA
jgi:hypothetical protein